MTVCDIVRLKELHTSGLLKIDPILADSFCHSSVVLHLGDHAYELSASSPVNVADSESYPNLQRIPLGIDGTILLPAGRTLLAPTLEKVAIPKSTAGILSGTSDIARLGVSVVHSAFVAPGYGEKTPSILTLEITSHVDYDILLHAGMRICHLLLNQLHSALDSGYDNGSNIYSAGEHVLPSMLHKRIKSP